MLDYYIDAWGSDLAHFNKWVDLHLPKKNICYYDKDEGYHWNSLNIENKLINILLI